MGGKPGVPFPRGLGSVAFWLRPPRDARLAQRRSECGQRLAWTRWRRGDGALRLGTAPPTAGSLFILEGLPRPSRGPGSRLPGSVAAGGPRAAGQPGVPVQLRAPLGLRSAASSPSVASLAPGSPHGPSPRLTPGACQPPLPRAPGDTRSPGPGHGPVLHSTFGKRGRNTHLRAPPPPGVPGIQAQERSETPRSPRQEPPVLGVGAARDMQDPLPRSNVRGTKHRWPLPNT